MTDVSLRDHMESRMQALEEKMQMTQVANEKALAAAKEANEYRLDALNELRLTVETMARTRAALSDVENLRTLFNSEIKSLRIEHETRIDSVASEMKSLSRQLYIIVGIITALQFLWRYLAGF